jgi:hypothetical protein
MEILLVLFPVLVALWIGLGTTHLFLHYRILQRIRQEHYATWIELGKPSLFSANSARSSWTVKKFLRSEQIRRLQDPQLERLRQYWGVTAKAYLAVFVCVLASMMFILNG